MGTGLEEISLSSLARHKRVPMIPPRIGCLSMSRNIVISSPGVLLHQSISHRSIRLPCASSPWQFVGIERRQMGDGPAIGLHLVVFACLMLHQFMYYNLSP